MDAVDKVPFKTYKRQLKSGTFIYVMFRKPDGTYQSGVNSKQTSVRSAIAWAEARLQSEAEAGVPTLAMYSDSFFADGGKYEEARSLFGGRGASLKNRGGHQYRLETYLLPELGSKRLNEIDGAAIRALQVKLSKTTYTKAGPSPRPADIVKAPRLISTQTIVHIVNTLSIILKFAAEEGVLQAVPVIRRVSVRPNTRGALTVDEAAQVLAGPWPDHRHRTINLLAAMTGMRQGELLGLQWDAVHRTHLEVFATWSEIEKALRGSRKAPATKAGRIRNVPLPAQAWAALLDLRAQSRPGSTLVFEAGIGRPMRTWDVTKGLKAALEAAGIDHLGRHIDFHSWRHFYNSLLVNARVPLPMVQATVGHASMAMTENYYHPGDGQAVVNAVESALPAQKLVHVQTDRQPQGDAVDP